MGMTEEFQGAEVIFSETLKEESFLDFQQLQQNPKKPSTVMTLKKKKKSDSLPVRIPNQMFNDLNDEEEDYFKDEGEMVPPHLILRRRVEGKMAFSVCTGNGRTLKGRDLSQVRDNILRMTGFLEA